MAQYYIGADVHSATTELAFEQNQRIVKRLTVPTTIPALREALGSVAGDKILTIEEGPMADWLWRNLKDAVDEMMVCDPRRNRLISADGDKDDPIDAGKLAALRRGGYLRAVHHPDDLHGPAPRGAHNRCMRTMFRSSTARIDRSDPLAFRRRTWQAKMGRKPAPNNTRSRLGQRNGMPDCKVSK